MKFQDKKILVIDDSEAMLQILEPLLEALGLKIAMAKNFAEALETFTKFDPDAVLADYFLGQNQTGLQLLSTVSSLLDGKKQPRLAILTTGDLSGGDAQKVSDLGAIVIQKPLKGKESVFRSAIEDWLK